MKGIILAGGSGTRLRQTAERLIGVRLFRIRQRPLEVRSEKDRASFHRIGNFVSIR